MRPSSEYLVCSFCNPSSRSEVLELELPVSDGVCLSRGPLLVLVGGIGVPIVVAPCGVVASSLDIGVDSRIFLLEIWSWYAGDFDRLLSC